jgi:hypothetical protein
MNTYGLYALVVAIMVLWPSAAVPGDPVRVDDLKDNVQVRLVAVREINDRRYAGAWFATFVTLDKAREEVTIGLGYPTVGETTHEQTLAVIVKGCVEGGERSIVRGATETKVREGVEAVFSIPKMDDKGNRKLDDCYLVSLKLGDKK